MINLFKTSNQIVEEIHNEIDSAQDRLLNEAKEFINSYSKNDKSDRLKSLGFLLSETVIEHEKTKSVFESNLKQAQLIEYYKMNYPFQKFITENELDRICKKYSLIHAPVSAYKKDVPDKNLKEIEKVPQLSQGDYPENLKYCTFKIDNSFILGASGNTWMGIWSKWRGILPRKATGHFRSEWALNEYLQNTYGCPYKYITSGGLMANITENRQGLFIAAPKSHFDLKSLGNTDRYGYKNISITVFETQDPIVFRYCNGGIQVLSKWGLEASDEALINPIEN